MRSANTSTHIRRHRLTDAPSRRFSLTATTRPNRTCDQPTCKYDGRRMNPRKTRRAPSEENPTIVPECNARKSTNALGVKCRRLRRPCQSYQFWDFENYLAETDNQDEIQAVYTNEPQSYGNLISQYRKGPTIWTPSYYQYDALGSTRVLTDESGDATDTYLYDAWGNELAVTGSTVNPFRWVGAVGYYWDEGTGTFYIRARVYEPVTGRWVSQDPLLYPVPQTLGHFDWDIAMANVRHHRNRYYFGNADSHNLYQYVSGNPLVYADPGGLKAVKVPYPVICTWCRTCVIGWRVFCGAIWAKRKPWTECTEPKVVYCPLPLGKDGQPPTDHSGKLLLEPRACCNAKRPKSHSIFCSVYSAKEWHLNPLVDPPMTNCDNLLFSWISNAGQGQGSQGHADCLEWCEKCLARIGMNDGMDVDLKKVLKKECIDGTCNYAYG